MLAHSLVDSGKIIVDLSLQGFIYSHFKGFIYSQK